VERPVPAPGGRREEDGAYWRAARDETVTYPPVEGPRTVDVAVVGGGIVGLTTAVLAAEAGLEVAVLEAREIGSGTTGGTTGKFTVQNGSRLSQLRNRFGDDGAATYARASLRGIELVDRLVEEHGLACDLEVAPAHLASLGPDQDEQVRAEAEATRAAGVAAQVSDGVEELDLDTGVVLTVPDQRQLHAVKLCHGLAAAVVELGGSVHEHARVVDVGPGRHSLRRWLVLTDRGSVAADHVVLATRLPSSRDRRLLFGRTKPVSAVGLAARITAPTPRGMYLFEGERTWSIRGSRPADGDERLIAVGVSEMTGDRPALGGRLEVLEGWTREHFPVQEVTHGWMAQDQQPSDGRPYIGPIGGEGIWTATGFGKWGLALGVGAAELLVGSMTRREDPYGGFFATGRLEPPAGWRSLLRANLRVGALFVGDRLRTPLRTPQLAPGEGRVVREGRRPVAVARDTEGRLHTVSATCTHLGCLVRWNEDAQTWDCGCHGSRFAVDGEVLEAPATVPLPPIQADEPDGG
jgi:glycine/D-amino acid oxidase-like deaminating enzyme/nitrite reductase/ring-hydroxylating ferredoxin subunit